MRNKSLFTITLSLLIGSAPPVLSQTRKKVSLLDSLDRQLDMSDFLIDANGFVPIPIIITEPALGGFGIGIAPVFITRRKPMLDREGRTKPVPPDVSGGAALYTVNNSWAALAFRSGSWLKAHSKYRVGGGYANINMLFYRKSAAGTEFSTEFNLRSTPFVGSLLRRFATSPWSAGISYTLLNTKVRVDGASLPDFVTDKEIKSVVSTPAITFEYDSRDNIFTPDKGIRSQLNIGFSDNAFGSDYDYQNLQAFVYGFFKLRQHVVAGLRFEMQQVFGDVPFYLEPYVDLRGVPIARYQADITSVAEAEVRWDIVSRWSATVFAGAGKASDSWSDLNDVSWIASGGGGFRYLIARKFKVRVGIDLARGPEQWAYYIVFGSAWRK